ncbi:MAG: SufE family protein [Azospirillaceae bacterium]
MTARPETQPSEDAGAAVPEDLVPIDEAQEDLVAEFGFFDDWMDKYQYLIDMGRKLPEFPEDWRADDYKVQGCQSQVWFVPEWHGDRLHLHARSDAHIVNGLIACLLRVYDWRTAQEILDTPPDFIAEIGLDQHLSGTRANGLRAMLDRIFSLARARGQGGGAA